MALTKVYAPSGPCPIPLTGPTPDTVRFWAESLRERWEEQGQYLTVAALRSFAQHTLTGGDLDLAVTLLHQEFADEHAQEREVTRQAVRGAYVTPAGAKPKEYAGPRVVDVAEAMTEAPVQVVASARKAVILGHPATSVVRWMGKAGWDVERACLVVAACGVDLALSTVRTQLTAGFKGERGGPAALSPGEVKQLEAM